MAMIDRNNLGSLIGADVIGSDDRKIGTIGQVFVDAATEQPSWVTINTGFFSTAESFAPLDRADWNGEVLRIAYEKSVVKDAPRIESDGALDRDSEDALYTHYRITAPTADGRNERSDRTADAYETSAGSETSTSRTDDARTDDAMIRSEEEVHVGTEQVSAGRARLRKHVVTENQTVTVPVSREEVTLEREPILDGTADSTASGRLMGDEEQEIQLTEERVVVEKKTVPVERVRLGTETVTDEQQVTEEVRKEQIDLDDTDATRDDRRSRDDTL